MLISQRRRGEPTAFSPADFDDIYLDTCSLMEQDFRVWLRRQLPDLLKINKKLTIPHPVVQELTYLAQGVTSNCCREAGQAKELVRKLVQTGVAELSGDRNVSQQADLYLVKTASAQRFRRRIAVITQDRQLTEDLNLLNRIGRANPIRTYKLERGVLVSTGKERHPCEEKERHLPLTYGDNAAQIYKQLGL